jgi:hypothetical protein
MAATVDGVAWRATGAGAVLTTPAGVPSLTVIGYSPVAGSTQADRDKPQLEIVFTGSEPPAGTYDIVTTASLTVMYMPDRASVYGAYSGRVTIAHIDSDSADGSFEFIAELAPAGPDVVLVTEGTFSVPIGR